MARKRTKKIFQVPGRGGNFQGGLLARGLQAGKMMQTRFVFLTAKGKHSISRETAAGIRDTAGTYGKMRFDRGLKNGRPHINIDPRGVSRRKNPHIDVPAWVVNSAPGIQKTLQYGGKALAIYAIAADTWRFGSAVYDDVQVNKALKEDLKRVDKAIEKMTEKLQQQILNDTERGKIASSYLWHQSYREWLQKKLQEVPKNAVKTGSSIAGGWAAGAGGGYAGAWAGGGTGAAIGAIGGPPGVLVGTFIGTVAGALAGGVSAGIAGSKVAEKIAESFYQELEDELMELFPEMEEFDLVDKINGCLFKDFLIILVAENERI